MMDRRNKKKSKEDETKEIANVLKLNNHYKELLRRQISDVPQEWRLNASDMKRICKYINNSIFDPDDCCLWHGYITNANNTSKGTYINFYFRSKKVALHRLLYNNFVAPLGPNDYLKFSCENKGICCNVTHYEKYRYTKGVAKVEPKKKATKKEQIPILQRIYPTSDNDFILRLDD